MKEQRPSYGGQAIIEGVMFGSKTKTVSAVRRKDDSIEYFEYPKPQIAWVNKLKKVPFIRGIVGLVESATIGSSHLNFSAEVFEDDYTEETPEEREQRKQKAKESSKIGMYLGVAVIGVLSFLLGKVLFTLIPMFVASFFSDIFPSRFAQVALESLFKFILLLGYLYAVSFTPIIKRVFQYHGAEHKVINTYEQGIPLTVENVRKETRLHFRCGSSFIIFTVFVAFIFYMFFPVDNIWLRMLTRLCLIPVVIGVSYEVLQLTNKLHGVKLFYWIALPGLYLQKLTTKEPDDAQIEVAILSFEKLLELENPTIYSDVNIQKIQG